MDDYKQLQDEALRGLGAVVVTWNLIDEALFRGFCRLSGMQEGPAAAVYGQLATLTPKLKMFSNLFKTGAVDEVETARWRPVLKPLLDLIEDRNNLVHSPLRWSNGRATFRLSGTTEDGAVEVVSQDGRGFSVLRSTVDELRGAKPDFPTYDSEAIWDHVRQAEELHAQLRALLR